VTTTLNVIAIAAAVLGTLALIAFFIGPRE
jgi:hypothetical protein